MGFNSGFKGLSTQRSTLAGHSPRLFKETFFFEQVMHRIS